MRKKLTEEAPHLAKEWMVEKNDRPIDEITAGSQYKAWWQCKNCSHNWQCPVSARTKGSGCPKCAGRFDISVIEKNPYLAKEWIKEKNDRPIEEITAGSGYLAWWECGTCNNNWQAKVTDRVKGTDCPRCAGQHRISLLDKAPHLAKEWIKEKNDRPIEEITSGSQYKAWWQCITCNNQWQAIVAKRTRGSGCKPCSYLKKRKRPYIVDEYQYLEEEWIKEKNDRPIEEITAGSVYKAWWKCNICANEWLADVQSRVLGTGCPKCAGQHGTPLLEQAPHLVQEWVSEKNDKPIIDITAGSSYKAWWQCETCENQWEAIVFLRVNERGCPKCAGYHGKSLLQEAPHLAKEWITDKNNRPIEKVTTGSNYKAWWKCKTCDYQWQAIVQNRVKGSGCPTCFNLRRRSHNS